MEGDLAQPTASASRRAVVAVTLIGLAGAWNGGNVGPVASQIGAEFDVSLAAVGLISGTMFLGAVVVGLLFAAQLGERTGLIGGLRIACLLLIVGNLLFAASPAFAGLAVARVFPGVAFALANVLGAVYARQAGGVALIGVFGASIQLGLAGALVIGSALADLGVDWRVGFVLSALLGLAAMLSLPATGAPGSDLPQRRPGFLRAALGRARVWRLGLLFIAVYGVPMTLSAWLVEYLVGEGDVSRAPAGALAFLLFGIAAAMRIEGARLERRGVPHARLVATMGLAVVGLLFVAIDPVLPLALLGVVAMGLGFALPYAEMMTEAQELFPDAPSEPMALLNLIALLPPIFVIPLVGRALDTGAGPQAFAALACFLALATVANLRRTGIPLEVR